MYKHVHPHTLPAIKLPLGYNLSLRACMITFTVTVTDTFMLLGETQQGLFSDWQG